MRQFVLLALFAVCFVGCRTPTTDPTETVVTGEVLLDGKALTMGEVYFENESGTKSGLGDINADGKYRVASAPVGPVKAAVRTSNHAQFAGTKTKEGKTVTVGGREGTYVAVPKRYEEVSTSKLTYTLTNDAVIKIELTTK